MKTGSAHEKPWVLGTVLNYTYVYPYHMLTNIDYPNVIHSTVALHCRF